MSNANDTFTYDSQTIHIASILLFIASTVCGIVGNMSLCYVILRTKSLRTHLNSCIMNIAVADLISCFLLMPFRMMTAGKTSWGRNVDVICKGEMFVRVSTDTARLLFLAYVSYERYLAIANPFNRDKKIPKLRAVISACFIWTVAFGLATFASFHFNNVALMHECELDWQKNDIDVVELYVTAPIFVTTVMLIVLFYILIIRILVKHGSTMSKYFGEKKKNKVKPVAADIAAGTSTNHKPQAGVEPASVVTIVADNSGDAVQQEAQKHSRTEDVMSSCPLPAVEVNDLTSNSRLATALLPNRTTAEESCVAEHDSKTVNSESNDNKSERKHNTELVTVRSQELDNKDVAKTDGKNRCTDQKKMDRNLTRTNSRDDVCFTQKDLTLCSEQAEITKCEMISNVSDVCVQKPEFKNEEDETFHLSQSGNQPRFLSEPVSRDSKHLQENVKSNSLRTEERDKNKFAFTKNKRIPLDGDVLADSESWAADENHPDDKKTELLEHYTTKLDDESDLDNKKNVLLEDKSVRTQRLGDDKDPGLENLAEDVASQETKSLLLMKKKCKTPQSLVLKNVKNEQTKKHVSQPKQCKVNNSEQNKTALSNAKETEENILLQMKKKSLSQGETERQTDTERQSETETQTNRKHLTEITEREKEKGETPTDEELPVLLQCRIQRRENQTGLQKEEIKETNKKKREKQDDEKRRYKTECKSDDTREKDAAQARTEQTAGQVCTANTVSDISHSSSQDDSSQTHSGTGAGIEETRKEEAKQREGAKTVQDSKETRKQEVKQCEVGKTVQDSKEVIKKEVKQCEVGNTAQDSKEVIKEEVIQCEVGKTVQDSKEVIKEEVKQCELGNTAQDSKERDGVTSSGEKQNKHDKKSANSSPSDTVSISRRKAVRTVNVVDMDGTVYRESLTNASGAVCKRDNDNKIKGRRKVELKAAKRIIAVIGTFFTLWTPFPVSVLLSRRLSASKADHAMWLDVLLLMSALSAVTSAVMPLLNGLSNKQIKSAAVRIFRKFFCFTCKKTARF